MIIHGDCLEELKKLEDNSIDAICCDPPYGLSFMGKKWDYDVPSKEIWQECLRVLKPGGYLLSFAGTRTQHRMAVNIEDAGFEIRDMIAWVYGCLSEDTEILTVNGWKRYHKAILSDTVVCYNIDNDNYELHKPSDKFYYDNKHTAYRIKSDTTDQIVSRNHRVIVERNGRKVFAQAETLERQESVPVLESLSALPDTIHNPQQGSSITKQDLLKKVWQQDDSRKEQWQEAGKDTVSSLQGNVLPNGQKQEQPTQGMFKKVQRLLTRSRLEETRTQGQSQLETRKRTGTGNKNDWRNQSKLERWFDLSEQKRQVRKSSDKIRQMSERILGYGSDRRLCYGTPIASSTADWQTTNTLGVSTPRQSRRNRQSYRKLNAIQDERGTQEIRVGSRHNTTLATVEPIEYTGKVWCVTVPTGAFVARRNGQIFITGNSGFPKSLNIGKQLEAGVHHSLAKSKVKKTGVDGVNGTEAQPAPDWENNEYGGGNGKCPKCGKWYISGSPCQCPKEKIEFTNPQAKQWEGWGTALKPAHEPICMARKPLGQQELDIAKNICYNITEKGLITNSEIIWRIKNVKNAEEQKTNEISSLIEQQKTAVVSAETVKTNGNESVGKKIQKLIDSICESGIQEIGNKPEKQVLKAISKTKIEYQDTGENINTNEKQKPLKHTEESASAVENQDLSSLPLTTLEVAEENTEKKLKMETSMSSLKSTDTQKTDIDCSAQTATSQWVCMDIVRILKVSFEGKEYDFIELSDGSLVWNENLEPYRKQRKLNVAENVLKWGTGGINIDGSRVETTDKYSYPNGAGGNSFSVGEEPDGKRTEPVESNSLGRFPANLIHDGSDEVVSLFPNTKPTKPHGGDGGKLDTQNMGWGFKRMPCELSDNGGSASRFFKTCSPTLEHDNMSVCKHTNANNVELSLIAFRATIGNIAPVNVEDWLDERLVQNVKSAGIKCELCATGIARELAKIRSLVFKNEGLLLTQDFIGNFKNSIPILNLASIVEVWENIDTTPTTQNLSQLFGSVLLAIDENTSLGRKEVEEESGEPKRFLYCPKTSKAERNKGCEGLHLGEPPASARSKPAKGMESALGKPRANNHPTVKPIALMEYLVKLVSREGAIVLDPFAGSGTTGLACKNINRKYILIEREEDYIKIIKARLDIKE